MEQVKLKGQHIKNFNKYMKKRDIKRMKIMRNMYPNSLQISIGYMILLKKSNKLEEQLLSEIMAKEIGLDVIKKQIEENDVLKTAEESNCTQLVEIRPKKHNIIETYCNELICSDYVKTKEIGLNSLINLKMLERKYKEAFLLITKNMNNGLKIDGLDRVLLFLCMELNVFINNFEFKNIRKYSYQQLLEHNMSQTYRHVMGHKQEKVKKYNTVFASKIELCELFNFISKLTIEDYLYRSNMLDEYIVPMPDIGQNGESLLKFLTIPNTNKIVNAFPIREKNK